MELVQPEVKIIVDFTGVTFISSALIAKLVLFNGAIGVAHGKWAMYGLLREVMEPFLITRLNRVFVITKDWEEALAYINGKLHLAH